MSAIISYSSRELLMTSLASIIAGQLADEIEKSASAVLAVPGGTTPGPLFDALSHADIDWSKIKIMLTDERWVPESSERSNTALVRRRLKKNKAQNAGFVTFDAVEPTPEDALPRLTAKLSGCLPLTVCLLGMGADRHTASLFPGADRLDEALSPDAPPLLPMRAAGAGEPRLTLTAPVLAGAAHVHLLTVGPDKKVALDQAYQDRSTSQSPVRVVLDQAQVHYAD